MNTVRSKIAEAVGRADIDKASSPSTKMLLALAATGKHIYQGTVSPAQIAHRRAKGKAARIARRANR